MGGCCILYKLQLQTTIALSMSESEYGALKSSMMRVVIPLREVMLEMMNYVGMKDCNSKEIFFPKQLHPMAQTDRQTDKQTNTRTWRLHD